MQKLSIITINYNNLEGLKRTVASVVNQTWKEFEYIIIDGGSSDGSVAYIDSQSENFTYWVSEKDSGIYNAMNKGIKIATGEYLLFLNSGDNFFNNQILEMNHQFLKLNDIVYFDLNVVDNESAFIKNYPSELSFSYFLKDTLPHPATFIKASLFEKIGLYDESYQIVSDWKFFVIGICKFNITYKRIDSTLTTFYLDGFSSDASNNALITSEKNTVLEANFLPFLKDVTELFQQKKIVENLKNSRKIQILVRMGLLKKF